MRLLSLARVLLIAATIVVSGCAATVKRTSSEAAEFRIPPQATMRLVLNVDGPPSATGAADWSGFRREWQEKFTEQSRAAGIAFQMQDGRAQPTGDAGTLLIVYVDDYRFLRPGTRYLTGVMSGNAYIESKLTFSDLKTGAVFGTLTANTSSSAWEGVFSAMTDKQVEAIAADVIKRLKQDQR